MSTRQNQDAAGMQRREFDTIRFARHPLCRPARVEDIPDATRFVARALPDFQLGDPSRFARLIQFDPDTIQLFFRKSQIIGLYSMLYPNRRGLQALLSNEFDAHAPAIGQLALLEERPSAIYNWLVVLPGPASAGFGVISELLSRDRYAAADLYARPLTPEGLRIMIGIGYQPLPGNKDNLYRYVRLSNRAKASQVAA